MSVLSFVKKLRGASAKPAAEKGSGKRESAGIRKSRKPAPAAVGVALPSIRLQLLLTEKGVKLQEENTVTFRVAAGVSKRQIAAAVKTQYGAVPRKIRTVLMPAKRRRRGQTKGMTSAWKKSYVRVDDIQSFNVGGGRG